MIEDDEESPAERAAPAKVLPLRSSGAVHPGLDRSIQGHIGAKLRAMYDDLAQQPVPDRFADLLASLQKRGREDER